MKKLIIGIVLILFVGMVNGQLTKMDSAWIRLVKNDTFTYKVDTFKVKIVYVDSLNYLKRADGIKVKSGYGNDRIAGYYDYKIEEKYFVKRDSLYIEIPEKEIIIIDGRK